MDLEYYQLWAEHFPRDPLIPHERHWQIGNEDLPSEDFPFTGVILCNATPAARKLLLAPHADRVDFDSVNKVWVNSNKKRVKVSIKRVLPESEPNSKAVSKSLQHAEGFEVQISYIPDFKESYVKTLIKTFEAGYGISAFQCTQTYRFQTLEALVEFVQPCKGLICSGQEDYVRNAL